MSTIDGLMRFTKAAMLSGIVLIAAPVWGQGASPPPAQPTPQQRVAMMKEWLKASQAQLRGYQWIETTVITKDGEEKSRQQNTCYYGADGKLQKVPVAGGTVAEEPSGPLRRRLAENKKAELEDYMRDAVALVHSYVPPDPERIQQVINGGQFSVTIVKPGSEVKLDFHGYMKPGDLLSTDVQLPTNRLLGISVTSYLEAPGDVVDLNVQMGVLVDGTIYAEKTVLNAQSKGLVVTVENSGYRRNAN